jgi:voltage-gated potassium channel Kch
MAQPPRIYLDTCALNRLFDEGSQARVRAESAAIERFFTQVFQETARWVISEVLEAEILNNPHSDVGSAMLELLGAATERIILSDAGIERADALEALGYGAFDARIWPARNRLGSMVY